MSRREDIVNSIWSDPDFEDLSLEATSLYLWSWTNPRCGMAGIYKVSKRAMGESKVPAEKLDDALEELADRGFAFYENGVLFVRTRVKHLRQKTEQIAKSISNDLQAIADSHPLKAMFMEEYRDARWLLYHLQTEGRSRVAGGSRGGQGFGSLEPEVRGSPEGRSTLQGNGKGNGKGKGKGSGEGLRKSRARAEQAKTWAHEHLPDLPTDFVAHIYGSMPGDPSPERVRAAVLVAYPSLKEEAA